MNENEIAGINAYHDAYWSAVEQGMYDDDPNPYSDTY